jgi:hypothetical protein
MADHDPDYANFWARSQAQPGETIFQSVPEGLDWIAKDEYVMFTEVNRVKQYLVSHPFHIQRLQVLATVRKEQEGDRGHFTTKAK